VQFECKEVWKVQQQPSAPETRVLPEQRSGWVDFAGAMTLVTGFLNLVDGLVALYRTRLFNEHFVIGNLRAWAWALLAFGVIQILAGLAILNRREWGRWFGIAAVTLNAVGQLLVIDAYPFWSMAIIAYDVAIFYALTVRWVRRPKLTTS
jgi:uncharacterized membrane protein (DUF2068 family)